MVQSVLGYARKTISGRPRARQLSRIATADRPAISRTPKSPTFLPYSTVLVTLVDRESHNLGLIVAVLIWIPENGS